MIIKVRLLNYCEGGAYDDMLDHLRYLGSVQILSVKREGHFLVVEVVPLGRKEWIEEFAIKRMRARDAIVEVYDTEERDERGKIQS